jgi:beta-lactamase regulating signal transducer with metallopeptidase domain
MNPTDWNPLFLSLAGLGVAGVVVVALAELFARRLERAQIQRAVWLSTATLLGGLALAEWTGARGALAPMWKRVERPTEAAAIAAASSQQPSTPMAAMVLSTSSVSLVAKPLVAATASTDRIAGWLAMGWIAGTGLLLARCGLALGLLSLVRRRFQAVNDTELLRRATEVREQLGMNRTPELRQGALASPMTFGLLRPVVCLPSDFSDAFTPDHQGAVLAHEFAHIAGLDALWRCLGEVLAALLWWHPAVWLVRRRLHTACELAADEASRLAGPFNGSLAEALVALAAKPGPVAPWPMLAAAGDGYHSDLGLRVERLLESSEAVPSLPKSGWRWSAAALVGAGAAMVALSACRTGGDSPVNQVGKALHRDEPSIALKQEVKPQDTNLVTRVFKVDPVTFVQALKSVVEPQLGTGEEKQTSESQLDFWEKLEASTTLPANIHSLVRSYFTQVGVDLTPPKAVFFNDRTGLLMVRAWGSDLEVIQSAIEVLNAAPPQITIEAKWIEVSDEGMKVLAKEWPALTPHPVAEPELSGTNKAKVFQEANATIRVDSETSEKAAILTPEQARELLKSMEGTKGASIITAPGVTTLSGRQAQISTLELRTVVTGVSSTNSPLGTSDIAYNTSAIPFGPTLDVIPYVEADGFTLALTVIATDSEFLGYDDPKGFVPERSTGGAEPIKGTLPLPRMRTRYFTSTARILDGQSLLLGGLTSTDTNTVHGRVKADGEAADVTTRTTKHLFVLITATIIDPAGNRVHQ